MRPTARQAQALAEMLAGHCRLYNAALEDGRTAYKQCGVSVSYGMQSAQLRDIRAFDPVAITGFGTATYRGAGDRGGRAMEIVEYDEETGEPIRLNGGYVRDEAGQATYLREVLEIFDTEGVDSAFVFLFALDSLPHRPDGDPRDDLDLASFDIVKVLEGRHGDTYPAMAWEPKAAFTALADCYRG